MRGTRGLLYWAIALCAAGAQSAEPGFVRITSHYDHSEVALVFDDGEIHYAKVLSSDESYATLPQCIEASNQVNLEFFTAFDFADLKSEVPTQNVDAKEVEWRIQEAHELLWRYEVVDLNLSHGDANCYFVAIRDDNDIVRFRLLGIVSAVLYVAPAGENAADTLMWLRGLLNHQPPASDSRR